MTHTPRTRRKAIFTLVLVTFLFTAGAGQAAAMERSHDGDFGAHVVVNLMERIGSFVSNLAVEVVDIFTKEGSEVTPNG